MRCDTIPAAFFFSWVCVCTYYPNFYFLIFFPFAEECPILGNTTFISSPYLILVCMYVLGVGVCICAKSLSNGRFPVNRGRHTFVVNWSVECKGGKVGGVLWIELCVCLGCRLMTGLGREWIEGHRKYEMCENIMSSHPHVVDLLVHINDLICEGFRWEVTSTCACWLVGPAYCWSYNRHIQQQDGKHDQPPTAIFFVPSLCY